MEARGWKKADLARASGLSLSTIYPLFDEKQLAWPQPQTLAKIAGALRGTVADLFKQNGVTWAPEPPTPEQALAVIARELETHRETPARDPLAERVAKLGPHDRQYVEDLVKGLEDSPTSPDPGQHPPERRK